MAALAFVSLGVLGAAQAATPKEVYVPGTRVSYILSKDPVTDANASSFYFNDEKTDDFVEFACFKGQPVFYLVAAVNILSAAGYEAAEAPVLTYRVDAQTPKTVPTLLLEPSEDPEDESHLNTLVVDDKNDALMFNAFKNATSKVVLRVKRSSGRELTMTLPVKGLSQALKAVNNCK